LISDRDETEKEKVFRQIWEETSNEADELIDQSLQATKEKIRSTEKGSSRIFTIPKLSRYAAIFLLPIITGITVWFIMENRQQDMEMAEWHIPDTEVQTILLSDGSIIQVNSGSVLIHPKEFSGKSRSVYLSGEAFFDIARIEKKPFTVKVNGQDIEVLGTKFNVMAYPNDSLLITTLQEGSVRLITAGHQQSTTLKPNQQFIYNKITGVTQLNDTDAKLSSSWTTGYYHFPGQSLQSILHRLGQVYGVNFSINSDNLKRKVLNATFYREQTIEDILEIINITIPFKYTIDDHQVIISEIT